MKRTAFLTLILVLSGVVAFTQDVSDLFYRAVHLQEVKGDLEAAIPLFEKVVSESKDPSIAAKAQLRIGMCYEKLGLTRAQQAYQKVIDRYPGQSQEVAAATERIAALNKARAAAEDKPGFRRIRVPVTIDQGAQLSPNGKLVTFSSARYEGNIWGAAIPGKVSGDIAGEPIKLTGDIKAWAWGHSWSYDGKWIAFNQLSSEKDVFVDSACVVSANGGAAKCIPLGTNRGGGFHLFQYCLSLSPDGTVIAYASKEGGKSYIYTVRIDGGERKRLTEADTWLPAFSPDGEKIAYVKERTAADGNAGSDVWVIPAKGGRPIQISNLGGRVNGPFWSPDGKWIAFNRDPDAQRLDCSEIWIVPATEKGAPANSPTKVDLPLRSSLRAAGWTHDNKIGLLLQNPRQATIYAVTVAGGKATQVAPDMAGFPSWSPDGSRIFFQSMVPSPKICSVPAEGGPAREVPISGSAEFTGFFNPEVSPDGQLIVFPSAKQGESSVHLWTISVRGGEARQITISPGTDAFPEWSPDGRSIMFSRQVKAGDSYKTSTYILDLEGGSPRELSFVPERPAFLTWSPDGQSVTYVTGGQIKTTSLDGMRSNVLAELETGHQGVKRMAWSRNGRRLAFTTKDGIFVLDLNNRKVEKLSTGLDAEPTALTWSPDGEKIAFDAARGGDYALWLMEDFLRLVKR